MPAYLSSEVLIFADDKTVLSHGTSHRSVAINIQSNLEKVYEYAVNNRLVPCAWTIKQSTSACEAKHLKLMRENLLF